MKPPSRPRKRQRTSLPGTDIYPTEWTTAASSLVERLDAIHSRCVIVRQDHLKCIADIDERVAVQETASRVAARVCTSSAAEEDTPILQKAESDTITELSKDVPRGPPSPLTLLLESEHPEKVLREKSIIARAQAINRKNSELARERLPKQPEPMRSKALQDYFLDEAVWLATDFIGERKWKMQMARKIAKMVVQYHNQQRRRAARAQVEEMQRIRKLATSMAKDVSKFWRQIGEIAEYRAALKTKAEQDRERKSKLKDLLEKTEAFSSELASTLRVLPSANHLNDTCNVVKHVSFGGGSVESQAEDRADVPVLQGGSPDENSVRDQSSTIVHVTGYVPSPGNSKREDHDSEFSSPARSSAVGHTDGYDDETTMAIAEAEEGRDPDELLTLQNQAQLPLEELLRSQGIDPLTYFSQKDSNATPENGVDDSDVSEASSWDDVVDDEETIRAAEAEDVPDVHEGQRLADEAAASIEEILRAQGIDPDVYRADRKMYLKPQSESRNSTLSTSASNDRKSTLIPSLENGVKEYETGRAMVPKRFTVSPVNMERLVKDRNTNAGTLEKYSSMNGQSTKLHEENQTHPECLSESQKNANSNQLAHKLVKGPGDECSKTVENGKAPPVHMVSGHGSNNSQNNLQDELFRGTLRDYQRRGLDWLLTLWRKNLNGILADDMGLGKTIQTIALLAWLAVKKGVWGPHLIVVPTSVMVNWEVEFKKWLPGFKVLTYFGSVKERKAKRRGWTRPDMFHVCITSYTLAVQDSVILRRKKWYYLILDEAHNIKNFESQRWQTLLTFSSRHRLLLTGTPLQNSVMELWSLMHFLMPKLFESHSWFKDTFWKPLIEVAEAEKDLNRGKSETVYTLHGILRPFLLRRLKKDVEKGLPPKSEHIILCRLSKRQRQLYEDFMARGDTRETLKSQDMLGVLNVLLQLRKVCNHPDLFEGRPILSPFSCKAIFYPVPTLVARATEHDAKKYVALHLMGLDFQYGEHNSPGKWYEDELEQISAVKVMQEEMDRSGRFRSLREAKESTEFRTGSQRAQHRRNESRTATLHHQVLVHALRIRQRALFGQDLRGVYSMTSSSLFHRFRKNSPSGIFWGTSRQSLVRSIEEVVEQAKPLADRFVCCVTKAIAPSVELRFYGDDMSRLRERDSFRQLTCASSELRALFREFEVRSQVTIPDTRLVQWDCGKLQTLDRLLRELKIRKSRALIFTQMTRMLDILESFLNLHCCRYLRLDGTTKADERQKVVERFNSDTRILCMILTTRAGGVGINLTGADTVIFYDSDYNPAIDDQAQDRAHRIGQTKPVRVYRLVCEQTVEENILKRAMGKRTLEQQIISHAGFTTDGIQRYRDSSQMMKPAQNAGENQNALRPVDNERPIVVNNEVQGTSQTPTSLLLGNAPKNGRRLSGSSEAFRSTESTAVQCSYGEFTGFKLANTSHVENEVERANSEVMTKGVVDGADEYQELTSKLLAKEDEREELALKAAEKEKRDLEAEFKDTAEEHRNQETATTGSDKTNDFAKVFNSLTRIQRYALRVLERMSGVESLPEPSHGDNVGVNPTTGFESAPGECSLPDDAKASDIDSTGEDDTETLLYEVDITDEGHASYLKALTDADADINMYLPLRDGGPEELKFSSVVHGTAAAGLECAEDAAFFPHAYNRMSRTMHATRRQKEKGLENLLRRRAEIERRRKLEVSCSAPNQISSPAASSVDSSRDGQLKTPVAAERARPKGKSEALSVPVQSASRKNRADSTIRVKTATGTSSLGSGSDPHHSSMGLFKIKPKKNTKRFTIPGIKSSIANYGSSISNEPNGVNDGWTKEEDEALIAAASACNNNMFLVADLLSSDLLVRMGVRRFRPVRHCVDRLLNVLGKDIKSGPPLPRAVSSDREIVQKHHTALQRAFSAVRAKNVYNSGQSGVEMHSSHQKLMAEAGTKMKGLVSPELLPPLTAILKCFSTPEHHKPGLKTTETGPQAVYKRRRPFMFPPRDDIRLLALTGGLSTAIGAAYQDQPAIKSGDPNLFQKGPGRGARSMNLGPTSRPNGQTRVAAGSRGSTPKMKTVDLKTKNQSSSQRPPQAGNLPPLNNLSHRESNASTAKPSAFHHVNLATNGQNVSLSRKKDGQNQTGATDHSVATTRVATTRVASSDLQKATKLSRGLPKSGGVPPSDAGSTSNATARKAARPQGLVQSMAVNSVPQNGDVRVYPVGTTTLLTGSQSRVGHSLSYGGGDGRAKALHSSYASSSGQTGNGRGSLVARSRGTSGTSGAPIDPSTSTGKPNQIRDGSSKSGNSMAPNPGTIHGPRVFRTVNAGAIRGAPRVASRGTSRGALKGASRGLSRGVSRVTISKPISRGMAIGRAVGLGRGNVAPRSVTAATVIGNGRGVTVARGTVARVEGVTRGVGVARGSVPGRGLIVSRSVPVTRTTVAPRDFAIARGTVVAQGRGASVMRQVPASSTIQLVPAGGMPSKADGSETRTAPSSSQAKAEQVAQVSIPGSGAPLGDRNNASHSEGSKNSGPTKSPSMKSSPAVTKKVTERAGESRRD